MVKKATSSKAVVKAAKKVEATSEYISQLIRAVPDQNGYRRIGVPMPSGTACQLVMAPNGVVFVSWGNNQFKSLRFGADRAAELVKDIGVITESLRGTSPAAIKSAKKADVIII